MASINDVAKLAGVSKSTVSKVLNNYDSVTPKTKEQVMQAVRELNYIPNQIAVALAKSDNRKVAIVVDPTSGSQTIDGINAKYLLGAVQKFDELEIDMVTIFSTLFNKFNNEELEMYLIKRGITGLIFFGIPKNNEQMNYLIDNEKFKIVVVDVNSVNKSTSSVSINNYEAQQVIALDVINRYKLKKILYIAGDDGGDTGLIRKKAIIDLDKNCDVQFEIVDGSYLESKAQQIVSKIGAKYDGIICASDIMAIGASRALKMQKLNRIVTGFDGIDLLAYIDDKILTVLQDFVKIGEEAAIEMGKLLDNNLGREVILPYQIDYVEIDKVIK